MSLLSGFRGVQEGRVYAHCECELWRWPCCRDHRLGQVCDRELPAFAFASAVSQLPSLLICQRHDLNRNSRSSEDKRCLALLVAHSDTAKDGAKIDYWTVQNTYGKQWGEGQLLRIA
eukprot:COSAG06_NODE_2727_length_6383_cov_3.025939_7_plen_117_part_00